MAGPGFGPFGGFGMPNPGPYGGFGGVGGPGWGNQISGPFGQGYGGFTTTWLNSEPRPSLLY